MRRIIMIVSIVVSAVTAIQAAGGPDVVRALPPEFVDTVVARVEGPTAVEALPDGRAVVLEQGGRLARVDDRDGSAEVVTLARFAVCSNSERGLLGFTLDPAYVTSGFVYVYRTVASDAPGGCHNRVSRFFMDEGGVDLGSEVVLVDRISSVAGNHNGGDVEIGNDGYLYISVGDAGRDPRGDSGSAGANDAAQDLSLLNGKILRVDRTTGFAAPGNPYTGAGTDDCRVRGNTPTTPRTTCREIFASGLRNPYRFAFDPNTSATRFFIDDVGQGTREEVDEGSVGANYGWPVREGRCPQGQNPPCPGPGPGLTDPVTDYGHDVGQFITGGAFVPNGVWPARFDGAYLVSEGATGTTWAWAGQPDLATAPEFLRATSPTDMVFVTGPSGAQLWYVQQNGEVHAVSYSAPPASDGSGPQRYVPLASPERRFDSRALTPPAPLRAGQTQLIDVEAPVGATAAVVNIALVQPSADGANLTVWKPGTPRPATSNVNAPAGANVANAAIVPLDDQGRFVVFAQATAHVLVDVSGFYVDAAAATSAGRVVATEPARVVDTREPAGAQNAFQRTPDGSGERVTVPVRGTAGVPLDANEVSAVALVVTGIARTGSNPGFVTAYPTGASRPASSSLNVNAAPDVRANLVVVPVGAAGSVELYLDGVDEVAVDVVGYVTGASSPSATAGRFHLLTPTREVDTRVGTGFGRLGAGQSATLDPASVPASASGIAQNLTIARTGGRGFVTAYPGGALPTVSNVNSSGAGQVRAAFAFTRLGSGSETFYAGDAPTDLIVDAFGWFE